MVSLDKGERMATSVRASTESLMTDEGKSTATPVRVLAARVRMKADRRLKRESPDWIKKLAAAGRGGA